jgi:hypothetical protein
MAENVNWRQIINSTYSRYLILEIADKNPIFKLAIDLGASSGAGSHRACAAIFDDAGFEFLRLELARLNWISCRSYSIFACRDVKHK